MKQYARFHVGMRLECLLYVNWFIDQCMLGWFAFCFRSFFNLPAYCISFKGENISIVESLCISCYCVAK